MRKLGGPISTLELETKHDIFFTHEDHARFMGGLQPLNLVITKDEIKLRVHESHGTGWVEGGHEMKEFKID